jgi:hypothetical protein
LSSYFDALSIDSTVAISFFIEELGSFDGKKEKDKKDEVRDEGSSKGGLKESGEE